VFAFFPSFDAVLQSIIFSSLSRLVVLSVLCWNSRSGRVAPV